MNNSTNFKNSKRARNRVQCGSMGINQAAAHLPLRVHLALLRRPWRPWGSLADPIRGHLLGWPSTSSRLLELCVCELREAREQARKEGLCVSERKGKLRVKTKQRKGQSTLVLGSERERERRGRAVCRGSRGKRKGGSKWAMAVSYFFCFFLESAQRSLLIVTATATRAPTHIRILVYSSSLISIFFFFLNSLLSLQVGHGTC